MGSSEIPLLSLVLVTYQDTGDDQVTEVVEGPPPDLDCEGDVKVGSRTALVENFIPFCRNR